MSGCKTVAADIIFAYCSPKLQHETVVVSCCCVEMNLMTVSFSLCWKCVAHDSHDIRHSATAAFLEKGKHLYYFKNNFENMENMYVPIS